MRFHVLGIEHTATSKEYASCAFTQKVLNLCKMLRMSGHTVYHYGNEGSSVECTEHVEILKEGQFLSPTDIYKHDQKEQEKLVRDFHTLAAGEIVKRREPGDFLLCPWSKHKAVSDVVTDVIPVESGIGYACVPFTNYAIFESYAIMHACYGFPAVTVADKHRWYWRVISNYFDPADFEPGYEKENYILFLGMRHGGEGKGYSIARDACRDAGVELWCAGTDEPKDLANNSHVKYLGHLDFEQRKKYLRDARALIAPSLFLEPFCGAAIEAYMSATPVISTDWGAFTEHNIQGKTGFRCHTHKEFVEAIDKVKKLDLTFIHSHSQQFTLENVRLKYDAYWDDVIKIYDGSGGWYAI